MRRRRPKKLGYKKLKTTFNALTLTGKIALDRTEWKRRIHIADIMGTESDYASIQRVNHFLETKFHTKDLGTLYHPISTHCNKNMS